MIPTYLGQKVIKVSVKNIPPEAETQWLLSGMVLAARNKNS